MMQSLKIEIPEIDNSLEQDEEYFILKSENDEKIYFHDYERIYQTKGLYEAIFHQKLNCQSPEIIKDLLFKNIEPTETRTDDLKILDFGAGNGMVAEALSIGNPETIIGVDIIEEAKDAAMRDRGDVYTDYFVTDLANAGEEVIRNLKMHEFNAMVSVAALGFDHIPPESFINAFNLIEKEGWIAFNIRDRFLTEEDKSGFRNTLSWIENDFMELVDEKTYVHRLSSNGDPIHYTAMIGRKVEDIKIAQTKVQTAEI